MASHDFIPAEDARFDTFLGELGDSVNAPLNPLQVTPDQKADFNAALTDWTPAWDVWKVVGPDVESKLQAKMTARTAVEKVARNINATVQASTTVENKAKSAAGLPVHKDARTAVGAIETASMLQRVDNEHLLQRLWFVDSATPASRAKPAGAASCEIRQQLVAGGGPPPVDPAGMPFLALDTRTPYRADLDAFHLGQTAYYALRWVNTRGEAGPWSSVEGHPVI